MCSMSVVCVCVFFLMYVLQGAIIFPVNVTYLNIYVYTPKYVRYVQYQNMVHLGKTSVKRGLCPCTPSTTLAYLKSFKITT